MSDGRRQVADQIPAVIGRYQITGSLGYGAMGAVYKAFDPLIKRPLAIKTVRLDIPRSSPQYLSFIERFQHEAQISGTLSHPGIVTLFDLGEDGGLPYFAMEFVDGRTVAEVLAEGERFKPEKVIGLVSQVAAALDYAHSRGVVHRDVKPANLILYDADKIKITDFGIAKLADTDITHAGALLGTPSYMSPEQAMGEKLDGRSDIFSLGVVAFEMLSGQQPFPGPNVTSILYKLVHTDPIEPADLEMNGLVPQKWHEVFGKVLAKKPEQRYQTASAFVQDLELLPRILVQRPRQRGERGPRGRGRPRHGRDSPPGAAGDRGGAAGRGRAPARVRHEEDTLVLDRSPRPAERAPAAADPDRVGRGHGDGVGARPAGGLADPAARSHAALAADAAGERPPRRARPDPHVPGIPQPLVLGGGALALVALVALVAWGCGRRRRRRQPPVLAPPPARRGGCCSPPPGRPRRPWPRRARCAWRVSPRARACCVDGRARGRSPLELAELRVRQLRGARRAAGLRARAKARRARAPARRRPSCGSCSSSGRRPATGAADFVSTPAGASVSVDGKPAGQTPLRGFKLQPGKRQVEMALDGHETWSSTLDVTAGETGRVEVRLARARPGAAHA